MLPHVMQSNEWKPTPVNKCSFQWWITRHRNSEDLHRAV